MSWSHQNTYRKVPSCTLKHVNCKNVSMGLSPLAQSIKQRMNIFSSKVTDHTQCNTCVSGNSSNNQFKHQVRCFHNAGDQLLIRSPTKAAVLWPLCCGIESLRYMRWDNKIAFRAVQELDFPVIPSWSAGFLSSIVSCITGALTVAK